MNISVLKNLICLSENNVYQITLASYLKENSLHMVIVTTLVNVESHFQILSFSSSVVQENTTPRLEHWFSSRNISRTVGPWGLLLSSRCSFHHQDNQHEFDRRLYREMFWLYLSLYLQIRKNWNLLSKKWKMFHIYGSLCRNKPLLCTQPWPERKQNPTRENVTWPIQALQMVTWASPKFKCNRLFLVGC